MAPPWVLDYVKLGLEHLLQEGVKEAAREVAGGDDDPDRATAAQRDAAMKWFKDKLHFQQVYLPQNGAYYSQNDSRWQGDSYPSKGRSASAPPSTRKIGDAGCAPSSLAIAHTTLLGTEATPKEVANFAVRNELSSNRPAGHPDGPGGTDIELVERWADEHGMDVKATKSLDELRDRLMEGAVAVVQVRGGIFNLRRDGSSPPRSKGHVIAVTGYAVDENGKEWFFVANPGMHGRAVTYADALAKKGMIVEKDLEHQGAGMVRVSREVLEDYMKGGGAHVLSKSTPS
jgi:hypothetical protein